MRLVLGKNVLLAGVATHGICEGLVALSFRDHTVVLSDHILDEFVEYYVGKFNFSHRGTVPFSLADSEKLGQSPMRLQAAVVADTFRRNSEVVVPTDVPGDAVGDVDDLPVLGTAVAGRADCLITGDKQLLDLGDYQGIPILSPRQFYERLRAGG